MTILDNQLQRCKDLADFWLSSQKAWEYYGDDDAMKKAENCKKEYQNYLDKIQELTLEIEALNAIEISISPQNPLSSQCQRLTGDGWNQIDWQGDLALSPCFIKHKKTGLVLKVI